MRGRIGGGAARRAGEGATGGFDPSGRPGMGGTAERFGAHGWMSGAGLAPLLSGGGGGRVSP